MESASAIMVERLDEYTAAVYSVDGHGRTLGDVYVVTDMGSASNARAIFRASLSKRVS